MNKLIEERNAIIKSNSYEIMQKKKRLEVGQIENK